MGKQGEKYRRSGEGSEMRESQTQASMGVLILACHLVVTGGTIQKEKLGVSCST